MVNIGVIAWKGGVGKTFIASHLVWGLAELGEKVLGIDLDNQGDLMKWMTGYTWKKQSDVKVSESITLLWRPGGEIQLPNGYGYAVFDGRPQVDISADILNMLDVAFIPIAGRLSQENARDLSSLQREMSPDTKMFLLANFIEMRLYITREEALISKKVGIPILDMGIPKTVKVRESEMTGRPVWEMSYANRGKVPAVLKSLCFFIQQGEWEKL